MAAQVTPTSDIVLVLGSGIVVWSIVIYWRLKAWRSTPEEWIAISRRYRPKTWERWPVYSSMWRHHDRHAAFHLWSARILTPLWGLLWTLGTVIVIADRW